MSNDYFTVTNYHLNLARQYGEKVAELHFSSGTHVPKTEQELWENHPQEDLIFQTTGEKVHDVEEAYLIIDAFEEGYFYYDKWETEDDDDEEAK